jgi:pimeloyl-ACP methyl ester carboxylesterase
VQIATRGLNFDVEVEGPSGGSPVVLLHGFPQCGAEWRRVAPLLHAAGLKTIVPEQRGYSPGARPEAVAAYVAAELAADIPALLDALELPTAHLVGHDVGSMVAWYVAGRYPERISTLTAVSVPHPMAFATAIRNDPDQQTKSSYFGFFRQEGVPEQALLADDAAALRAIFTGSGQAPEDVDVYVAPLREPGALTGALNWYRAMPYTDPSELGPVAVPTTFVWSDDDLAVGRTAVDGCAAYVKADYRFVVLPGISHWIADQAPEPLAEAIIARVQG